MLDIKRVNLLKIFVLTLVAFPGTIMAQSLELENDMARYESSFCPIPKVDDSRWQAIPIEEWEKTFQFLANSANSNLERLVTWNASYNLVRGADLSSVAKRISPTIIKNASNIPFYYVMNQRYSFYRDNENDRSYISLARQGDLTFYNSRYEKEDYDKLDPQIVIRPNLKAIVTPDRLLLYEYDRALRRSETLQRLGYEEFGKNCVVLPPDSGRISPIGAVFDPQFFFFQSLRPRYKYWTDMEHGLLLTLQAYRNKTDDTVTQRVKVQKATVEGVDWVRIEHGLKKTDPVSVYYCNSESGYNIVSYTVSLNGVDLIDTKFEYEEVDGVFIPKRVMFKNRNFNPKDDHIPSFKYFELVKAEVNKPIPDEQFVMDALGLDDDVTIYDKTEKSYYAYEKGKEKTEPILRFDGLPNGNKTRATSTPLWRSPIRMTALCLGLCLLVFGVIYKVRRKRASS